MDAMDAATRLVVLKVHPQATAGDPGKAQDGNLMVKHANTWWF